MNHETQEELQPGRPCQDSPTMKNDFSLFTSIHVHLRFVFFLGAAMMAYGQISPSDGPTHSFDPKQIQISLIQTWILSITRWRILRCPEIRQTFTPRTTSST